MIDGAHLQKQIKRKKKRNKKEKKNNFEIKNKKLKRK